MAVVNPALWIDEVSEANAMGHTAAIAQWVRLSGTEDERKAFDYISEQVSGFGLRAVLYEPTCLVSLPLSGSIVIEDEDFPLCITHAFSASTPESGVAGELVYAGDGSESALLAAGAAGKIALTDGLATPGKAHAATKVGALAVVSVSGDHLHEMIVSPIWGSPTPETLPLLPRTPMVSVDTAAGERMRRRLERGRVRARVRTTVDTGWRPIPVLIADLDVDNREYVMFSGHVDSWHYGAMDNGSANATMLEVARILAAHRGELRRGLRLAFWSGHSHARYAGSTWFADRFWFDLRANCVAHVNVDSTGAINATTLADANTMAETYPLARDVIVRQTGQHLEYRRFGRAGDQSFWGIGLPAVFMSLSHQGETSETSSALAALTGGTVARSGGLGWWWHTTEDTLDKIDPANLVRDIRVYVEVVGRLTTEPIVPLDVRGPLAEIARALDEIEPLWAGLPSGGDADAPGFELLRHDLEAATAAAEDVMAWVQRGGHDEAMATRLSAAVVAACKALVPVNYTVAGEFGHDLALGATTLPALRPPKALVAMSDDELWGATHGLRRAINRVRAGIQAARWELERAGETSGP